MKAKKVWIADDYFYHLLVTANNKSYHTKFKRVYYTKNKTFKYIKSLDVINMNKKLREFDLIDKIKKDFNAKAVTLK